MPRFNGTTCTDPENFEIDWIPLFHLNGTEPNADLMQGVACNQSDIVDDPIDPNNSNKVLICHKRKKKGKTTWKTISVSINALNAHLGHGDYCGPCASGNSGVEDVADMDHGDEFHTNLYPNPTQNSSVLAVEVHEDTDITLAVYNMQGVLVKEVYSGPISAGLEHHFELEGNGLAAGVYQVILRNQADMKSHRWIIQR